MSESFEFTFDLPVYPERVYRAWLDSAEHSRFTGHPARIEARAGGKFSSMDGLVESEFRVMTPFGRIVQTWHMPDLPAGEIELLLEPTCTGTEVRLKQSGVPDGKTPQMMQWWETRYFRPLRAYFDALLGEYPADMRDG